LLFIFAPEYTDDHTFIPKNTSLIVSRIPLTTQQKKAWFVKDFVTKSLNISKKQPI